MPELVLTSLKFLFLALLYVFIARAIRVIWLDLTGPRASKAPRGRRRDGRAVRGAQSAVKGAAGAGIGAPTIRTTSAATTAVRSSPKKPAKIRALVVTEEGLPPRNYPLDGQQAITFGRGSDCNVVLKDTYVSQVHTRVFCKDGTWLVEDMGSTNGTYLNRTKVSDPTPVSPGDEVRLGKTVVEVRR